MENLRFPFNLKSGAPPSEEVKEEIPAQHRSQNSEPTATDLKIEPQQQVRNDFITSAFRENLRDWGPNGRA